MKDTLRIVLNGEIPNSGIKSHTTRNMLSTFDDADTVQSKYVKYVGRVNYEKKGGFGDAPTVAMEGTIIGSSGEVLLNLTRHFSDAYKLSLNTSPQARSYGDSDNAIFTPMAEIVLDKIPTYEAS